MLSLRVLYLLSLIIYSTYCQSTIRIGIIDDNDDRKEFVDINISNLTFCGQKELNLQLHWMNTSNSLPNLFNKLELKQNLTNIYLTHTGKFSTKLIQDFCQTNHIPFINMKSYEDKIMLCSITTYVIFCTNSFL
jgi:hypothetical protein